jgi:hypothetical protein
MLTKLLFTALVVAGVYALYRFRTRTGPQPSKPDTPADNRFGRLVSYGFVGVLITISAIAYYFHWQSQRQVVSVRVIDSGTGNLTTYQVYRHSIEGRHLQTVDGRSVRLGAGERLEVLDNE